MSISVGEVYTGFSKFDMSYKFKIIETSETYSAVLVECIDNPDMSSRRPNTLLSTRGLYAIIGNYEHNITGVAFNSKLNSVQNLYVNNQHLLHNGVYNLNIEDDKQRVPVGFRYWIDIDRFATNHGYKLYRQKDMWLDLEERLSVDGI